MSEMERAIAAVAFTRLLDAIEAWWDGVADADDLYQYAQEVRDCMDKHEAWPREVAGV